MYVKPGNGGGEAAAFVLGLSSCVLVIVYATVAFLTFRQKMRNAKHQGPETEISFYENAKEAIDNCFSLAKGVSSSYNPNPMPVPTIIYMYYNQARA